MLNHSTHMPFFDCAHRIKAPFKIKKNKKNALTGAVVMPDTYSEQAQNLLTGKLKKLPESFITLSAPSDIISEKASYGAAKARVKGLLIQSYELKTQPLKQLTALALDAHATLGWHVELAAMSHELTAIRPLLFEFPSACIHLVDFSKKHLPELFRLAAQGIRFKTCGFLSNNPNKEEQIQILIEMHAINPNTLMYGSNTSNESIITDEIQLIRSIFCEESAQRILLRNAENFYKIDNTVH